MQQYNLCVAASAAVAIHDGGLQPGRASTIHRTFGYNGLMQLKVVPASNSGIGYRQVPARGFTRLVVEAGAVCIVCCDCSASDLDLDIECAGTLIFVEALRRFKLGVLVTGRGRVLALGAVALHSAVVECRDDADCSGLEARRLELAVYDRARCSARGTRVSARLRHGLGAAPCALVYDAASPTTGPLAAPCETCAGSNTTAYECAVQQRPWLESRRFFTAGVARGDVVHSLAAYLWDAADGIGAAVAACLVDAGTAALIRLKVDTLIEAQTLGMPWPALAWPASEFRGPPLGASVSTSAGAGAGAGAVASGPWHGDVVPLPGLSGRPHNASCGCASCRYPRLVAVPSVSAPSHAPRQLEQLVARPAPSAHANRFRAAHHTGAIDCGCSPCVFERAYRVPAPPLCEPARTPVSADFDTTGAFPVTLRTPPGLEGTECSVCQDAPVAVLLLDCYHLVLCRACAVRLSRGERAQARCPLCRAPIVRAVPCFSGAHVEVASPAAQATG